VWGVRVGFEDPCLQVRIDRSDDFQRRRRTRRSQRSIEAVGWDTEGNINSNRSSSSSSSSSSRQSAKQIVGAGVVAHTLFGSSRFFLLVAEEF
jgi:hypothetical protein